MQSTATTGTANNIQSEKESNLDKEESKGSNGKCWKSILEEKLLSKQLKREEVLIICVLNLMF